MTVVALFLSPDVLYPFLNLVFHPGALKVAFQMRVV